ncbi:MAG: hypothetical protein KF700_00400 [Hyphomonadaceae bacterium]|nr:hypothetical protein [Hyphomonadaceae bacterium]
MSDAAGLRTLAAAVAYFLIAFAAGFAFAIPRTLLVEPHLGQVGAVLLEAPVMLGVCWFAAGAVMARVAPGAGAGRALAVGGLWLALLVTAEFGVGLWARGLSAREALGAFLTPAGLLGLAMQLVCAAFPVLRR